MHDTESNTRLQGGKRLILAGLIAMLIVAGAAAVTWRVCLSDRNAAQDDQRVVTMQLTGTPGAPFVGHYIRNGERVAANGVLPATFADSCVWGCEFRKADPNQVLTLEARDGRSYASITAASGLCGVRANMKDGWNIGHLTK